MAEPPTECWNSKVPPGSNCACATSMVVELLAVSPSFTDRLSICGSSHSPSDSTTQPSCASRPSWPRAASVWSSIADRSTGSDHARSPSR